MLYGTLNDLWKMPVLFVLLATFALKPVTRPQVVMCLKQLKNGTARGPDKIPTNLVKDVANFILQPLTLIYNS